MLKIFSKFLRLTMAVGVFFIVWSCETPLGDIRTNCQFNDCIYLNESCPIEILVFDTTGVPVGQLFFFTENEITKITSSIHPNQSEEMMIEIVDEGILKRDSFFISSSIDSVFFQIEEKSTLTVTQTSTGKIYEDTFLCPDDYKE